MTSLPHSSAAPWAQLLTLTVLFALQPLSTDLYLPALPGIAEHFQASIAQTQTTLTIFVIAFGLAQLIAGPLSDRFGRWPNAVAAALLYTGASLTCALAPSLEVLILGRLLQAIGACMALVNARAIIRDNYGPQEGARLIAKSGSLMSIAILSGPTLGGWLQTVFGWRAAFLTLSLIGIFTLVAVACLTKETNSYKNPQATHPAFLMASYGAVLRHPRFIAYTAAQTASYAGLFAFLSGSSPVLQKVLGFSAQQYGLFFSACAVGYLLGTFVCRKALSLYGLFKTMHLAALIVLIGGLIMSSLALAGVKHGAAIGVPMFIYMIGHGVGTPCSQVGAIAAFPSQAGSAAGLMGFLQMCGASLVGLWMGMSFDGSVFPLTLTIGACAVILFLVVFSLVGRHGELH